MTGIETGIEAAIRRGDRVRHKDGAEAIALGDADGGLFAAHVPDLGLLLWRVADVDVIRAEDRPAIVAEGVA